MSPMFTLYKLYFVCEASEEGFINSGGEDQSAGGCSARQSRSGVSTVSIQISELQYRYKPGRI